MGNRSLLVLALHVATASCFTPAALPAVQSRGATPRTIVMVKGRRAALATFGLAALAFPLTASADSIEDIAARSNAAAKAEAAKKQAAFEAGVEEPKASYTPIIAIAGGGVLASTYFYSQNLKRLGEKVITGKGRKYD